MCPAWESPDEPRTGVLMDRIHIYMYISKIRSDVTVFRERGAVMFDLRWCPYQLAINPMVGGVILIAEFGGQWGWKIVSIHISHDCFEKKLDG